MTIEETGKLLALCAAYDYRKVDEADIIAWHTLFSSSGEPLTFSRAHRRIMDWYAKRRERISPADIINPRPESGAW